MKSYTAVIILFYTFQVFCSVLCLYSPVWLTLLGWLEGVIGVCDGHIYIYTHLLYRLALLQEWREGGGQIATQA